MNFWGLMLCIQTPKSEANLVSHPVTLRTRCHVTNLREYKINSLGTSCSQVVSSAIASDLACRSRSVLNSVLQPFSL